MVEKEVAPDPRSAGWHVGDRTPVVKGDMASAAPMRTITGHAASGSRSQEQILRALHLVGPLADTLEGRVEAMHRLADRSAAVRAERKAWRDRVRRGELSVPDLLDHPPAVLGAVKVTTLLRWQPYLGERRSKQVARDVGIISETLRLERCSPATRANLSAAIRTRLQAQAERAERDRRRRARLEVA